MILEKIGAVAVALLFLFLALSTKPFRMRGGYEPPLILEMVVRIFFLYLAVKTLVHFLP